jgi:hypothetical protein
MARRNRNKYAALAAARRGNWAAAVQHDHLDLLDEAMLTDVFNMARRHPRSDERDQAMDVLRDELKRREIDAAHALEMGR